MYKRIICFFNLIIIVIVKSYLLQSNFRIISRENLCDTVGNFCNLNEVLNNPINKQLKIKTYNNKSISFNYETSSCINNYNYKHKYLIIDKYNYYVRYSFSLYDDINEKNNYLFKIKATEIIKNNNKLTLWNINVKYDKTSVIYIPNMKAILYHYIEMCINKKPKTPNKLLLEYLK